MKKVFIFSILMCFAIVAQAQFSQFHAGLVLPTGKFGEGDTKSISESKGYAATGFTIGYKNYFPMSTENLSGVFGVSLFFNGLNSDFKDMYEEMGDDLDFTFPKYLNFPVTLGLNYSFPLQENIKIYGEAAVGGNLSMMTKFSISDGDDELVTKTDSAFGFAWALEGGAFINDKFSIGIRLNNLGSYKYKYTIEYDGEKEKGKNTKALPITGISLCLGILF